MRIKRTGDDIKFSVFSPLSYLYVVIILLVVLVGTILIIAFSVDVSPKIVLAAAVPIGFNYGLLMICIIISDMIRKKLFAERPVKKILMATRQITNGDLSARIPVRRKKHMPRNEYDVIIDNFNLMAEQLSRTETIQTDFITNVSHEMKTPLAVIQNCATILNDADIDEATRTENARTVMASTKRLADLIGNILRLSKLENNDVEPEWKRFDLSAQLCDTLLAMEDLWEDKKINVQADIEDEIFIENDEVLLNVIWQNLLSNAHKFTPDGGIVSVSAKKINGKAVVKISDTGCGIPEDKLPYIFEKFYQCDSSHSTKGNGLGLALVKRVADLAGADVEVVSEYGHGTAFTITV